jgi:hypothetical protein
MGFLPLLYLIDLIKLRLYHAQYLKHLCNGNSIVWHAIISTSRRNVDSLFVDYGVFLGATDASYVRAMWPRFTNELGIIP